MAQNDTNHEVADRLSEQSKKTAKMAGKGINSVTRKAQKKMKNAVKRFAKKATKKAVKMAAKAVAKIIKIIIDLIIAFLPYVLIILGIVIVIWIVSAFFIDQELESKSQMNNYQSESAKEENQIAYNPETGKYEVIKYSKGNKIVKMYYAYMAQKGFWKVVKDENGKEIQELVRGDDEKAKKYVDRYNREKEFILNSDLLYLLDKYLNSGTGNKFYFPEQFIQPVYHDKKYNLKNLTNKDGDLVVKSTKYTKDGKPTDEKVKGLWDYGFGSILQYQEYKEDREKRAEKRVTYQWNYNTHKLEKVNIPEGKGEKITEKVSGYPRKTYLITKVTNAIGTIGNKVKVEWKQTNEPFTKTVKRKIKGEKLETYQVEEQVKNSNGESLYWKQDPDKVSAKEGNSKTTEKTNWEATQTVTKTHWVDTEIEIEETYKGYVWEKIPQYDGEPNTDGIVGDKYIFDYLTNYKSYVPNEVMESFDIEKRTNKKIEGLEEIYEEQEALENTESAYDGISDTEGQENTQPKDYSGQITGEQGKYKNAARFLSYYETYGNRYGVDPYLLLAIAAQESGGNDNIDESRYGSAGVGLMQIVASTGQAGITATNLETGQKETLHLNSASDHTAEKTIQFCAMYLQGLIKAQHGNVLAALRGYNSGGGAMLSAMKRFASDKGISLDEAYKRPAEEWLPYNTVGDTKYVENVLQYYSSPDGKPWMMDSSGTKYFADGSVQKGAKIIGDGTSDNKSWFSNLLEKIKDHWNDLFSDSPTDAFMNKSKYTWIEYEYKMSENKFKSFMRLYRTYIEKKSYSEVKEEWTLEDWKARYKALFENPDISSTNKEEDADMAAYNQFMQYFPDGISDPVDKIKDVGNYDGTSIELSVNKNVTIKSMIDGKVTSVNAGQGIVEITQNNGVKIRYTGLSSIVVKKGEKIKQGDKIAVSKKNITLTFIDNKGNSIDPSPYFTNITGSNQIYNLQVVLSAIESVEGYPYEMTGAANDKSHGAFDCSGLMQWAFKQVGINLPRTAYQQYLAVKKIPESQAKPGDLIFFSGTYNSGNPISHVGLYLGNGKFWNAQGKGVRIASLTNDPSDGNWWSQFPHYFGRITK